LSMDRKGAYGARGSLPLLVATIVAAGIAMAFLTPATGNQGSYAAVSVPNVGGFSSELSFSTPGPAGPQTVVVKHAGAKPQRASTQPSLQNELLGGSGSSIEFFANVTIESRSASATMGSVIAEAYSQGGYVAYSFISGLYASVVVRVPAASFESTISAIRSLGNVTSLTTTSNDVTVRYNDLNATLASLKTEQSSLLRLLSGTSSVNATLAIEAQLQRVNQQVNAVESEIMQIQRLVAYSTISVSITQREAQRQLSVRLTATPRSGAAPLSTTFTAVVSGGVPPYYVNYNFGDGTSQEGLVVIHKYYGSGEYNATVTVTDSNGSTVETYALVQVAPARVQSGLPDFANAVTGLFVRVVEGIVEVAVVSLPVALVAFAVALPLKKWYARRVRQV
jgi:PKD repeat protein